MAVRTHAVASVGYRVPQRTWQGVVRAVFARACYVECDGALLTLATHGVADGPATLVLHGSVPADLRPLIAADDVLRRCGDRIEGRDVAFDLARATTWRSRAPRWLLDRRGRARRSALARSRLAHARATRPSVLDRSGDRAIEDVEQACRALDVSAARLRLARFVGWGEGLTPAGDDYVVGLCASLRALAEGNARRTAFLQALQGFVASLCVRTTPVSAHYLRLAAGGHFNADVLRARDALRAVRDDGRAQAAFEALIAVGSTSGADALTGILSGYAAWDQPYVRHTT